MATRLLVTLSLIIMMWCAAVNGLCIDNSNFTLCSADSTCEWCGTQQSVFPVGVCYEKGSGTCCATNCSTNYYCYPPAIICNASTVCTVSPDPSTYDPACQVASCCATETPIACGSQCIPKTEQCCDDMGGTCNTTSLCCGSSFTGLACCDPKFSICCEAPDGYSHWCCPADQYCSLEGYCQPTPQ